MVFVDCSLLLLQLPYYSATLLLHYSTTQLLDYSTTVPLHSTSTKMGKSSPKKKKNSSGVSGLTKQFGGMEMKGSSAGEDFLNKCETQG